MKKRKFLMPLAALAAVFASDQAVANIAPEPTVPHTDRSDVTTATQQGDRVVTNDGRNQFSFILKRDSGGQLMAWHESHYSHYSHDSHSSHSSHSSHYSGY